MWARDARWCRLKTSKRPLFRKHHLPMLLCVALNEHPVIHVRAEGLLDSPNLRAARPS